MAAMALPLSEAASATIATSDSGYFVRHYPTMVWMSCGLPFGEASSR
jgi:hypothetical protein